MHTIVSAYSTDTRTHAHTHIRYQIHNSLRTKLCSQAQCLQRSPVSSIELQLFYGTNLRQVIKQWLYSCDIRSLLLQIGFYDTDKAHLTRTTFAHKQLRVPGGQVPFYFWMQVSSNGQASYMLASKVSLKLQQKARSISDVQQPVSKFRFPLSSFSNLRPAKGLRMVFGGFNWL